MSPFSWISEEEKSVNKVKVNITKVLKGTNENVIWIHLAQNNIQWWITANMVMNFPVPHKAVNYRCIWSSEYPSTQIKNKIFVIYPSWETCVGSSLSSLTANYYTFIGNFSWKIWQFPFMPMVLRIISLLLIGVRCRTQDILRNSNFAEYAYHEPENFLKDNLVE